MSKLWNILWVRLALVFGMVTAASITIVAILINWQTETRFRDYYVYSQIADSGLLDAAGDYYAEQGDWTGVQTIFENQPRQGDERGPGPNWGRPGMPPITLVDTNGNVLYDSHAGPHERRQEKPQSTENAVPVEVDGKTVGYFLLATEAELPQFTESAQRFLDQINEFLLQAGLLAGVITVVAGFVVARGLTAPLNHLKKAARGIAEGNLKQTVPVKGAEEIAEVAQAFNDMSAALQQGEALRRNMVADVAHELRTPLTVIQGSLRAILDDVYTLDKSEIAAIYNQTLMLKRLVNDLHELSQAEAHQLKLNIRPVAPAPVITEMVNLFEEVANEQQVTLQTHLTPNLPDLLADPERVQQCLYNLLTNALRHTPAGGKVSVTVEPDAASSAKADFVRVGVNDTGEGIAASDLPYVFDRFWQADKSRSGAHNGSGLGLAITQQLVLAQGGKIGVESKPGEGSRFWFMLPAAV